MRIHLIVKIKLLKETSNSNKKEIYLISKNRKRICGFKTG